MNEIKLGLGPSPRPFYIYIDQDKGPYGWYTLDTSAVEAQVVPLEEPALTGFIVRVDVKEQEYKGEVNEKLQVHFQAGNRRYIVRAGLYTAFSRCVLAALARLRAEHFATPICIEPDKSKNAEKVVFANIYNAVNGRKVGYEYPKEDVQVDELLNHVIAIVATSQGEEPPEQRVVAPPPPPPPPAAKEPYRRGQAPPPHPLGFPPRGDLANTAYAPQPAAPAKRPTPYDDDDMPF